jgi:tetratricopeptide (TPR) repeat protein
MGKKKKPEKYLLTKEKQGQNKTARPSQNDTPRWHVPFILIITFIAYLPALNAGFVNWDDGDYVGDNILVKEISRTGELLVTPVQGNHHPITMLSLSINYILSGENAWSYHLLNLLFHLANCFLVYRLSLLLSRNNVIIAFTTSLLFGIHPMHVESVAWISERKDVLYSLFFLAGLISYTSYLDTGLRKHFRLVILFCILSLLSKPAAVIFPVALFCIDLLRRRKFSISLFTEKILFFIPAIIMGIITVIAQKSAGATEGEPFGLGKNILFGFYGIMMYFVKMILPLKLSAFYPFPPINENLPAVYYVSPLFSVALAVLFFLSMKKNRVAAFGISFYIVNLLLVLQVFSVGSAVMSERYTYLPYIGWFYIGGYLLSQFGKNNQLKAYSVIIPAAFIFSVLTFLQSQKWKNGETLWDSVIKTNPSSRAYSARATLFRKKASALKQEAGLLMQKNQMEEANKKNDEANKNYDQAIAYYSEAVRINKIDHESYNNRANIYMDLNKFDLAHQDYKSALAIKPDYFTTLDNIGAMYARKNQFDSALYYLDRAIKIKPDYKASYSNRGLVLMSLKRYDEAIRDWKKFLEFEPNAADVVNTIGMCLRLQGRYQEALTYIDRAIQMTPHVPQFYLNRSYTHSVLNNKAQALKDALTARQNGVPVDQAYINSLGGQ